MVLQDTDFPEDMEDLGIIKEGRDFGDDEEEEGDCARLASMHEEGFLDEDAFDEGDQDFSF